MESNLDGVQPDAGRPQNRVEASARKTVVVAGDPSIEWRITRSAVPDHGLVLPEFSTRVYSEPGGVTALAKLIDAAVSGDHDVMWAKNLPSGETRPSTAPFWHLYTTCSQKRFSTQEKDRSSNAVWRVDEWLGIDRPLKGALPPEFHLNEPNKGDLVVIEDARNGFADDEPAWPRSFLNPKPGAWLVLRWAGAHFDRGNMANFWKRACRNFNGRIVLVVTVDELCIAAMRINRSLSWERTAQDVAREINNRDELKACAHIVVGFSTAGSMLFSPVGRNFCAHLYYDPAHLYKTWNADYEGMMIGYTRCLTAGVVLDMLGTGGPIRSPGRTGIVAGMAAARVLQRNGFAPIKDDGVSTDDAPLPYQLLFPVKDIAARLRSEFTKPTAFTASFLDCVVPPRKPNWRILDAALPDEPKIVIAASSIVEHGDDFYDWQFPIARFGKTFLAIDRPEIESIRAIQELIKNYVAAAAVSAPVSIAVFGAPGNGKSHAIKAVAEHLATQVKLEARTFNLSQFTSPQSINNALHEVRDVGLSGKLPLVFWDEFDANYDNEEFGWLRFFLAPMQDGKFQDGQLTHNVGKAIFVFAGATSHTKGDFEMKAGLSERTKTNVISKSIVRLAGQMKDRKNAGNKTEDFLSRLSGYVDITDLNHKPGRLDPAVAIRRAVRLRTVLKQSAGNLVHSFPGPNNRLHERVNIDANVLRAFLLIPVYKHGARSIEAIVKMSALSGRKRFDPSNLPPAEQLGLHVDAAAFIELLRSSVRG